MTNLVFLIPAALILGAMGLVGFLWALRSGQYEDLDGAAHRILLDDDEAPAPSPRKR
ncbi:MAG: cbb3-type cytochrome oxidase assembly protein CcoS [Rhizobiaceae bacterium]|nr:cbb3-type cytochrome oxidase assembly protein CcoS [Rhizobiaceae bacterium]